MIRTETQLELFSIITHPDRIVICPQCNHHIMALRTWPDGKVSCEFIGKDNRCYDCTYPRKAKNSSTRVAE